MFAVHQIPHCIWQGKIWNQNIFSWKEPRKTGGGLEKWEGESKATVYPEQDGNSWEPVAQKQPEMLLWRYGQNGERNDGWKGEIKKSDQLEILENLWARSVECSLPKKTFNIVDKYNKK